MERERINGRVIRVGGFRNIYSFIKTLCYQCPGFWLSEFMFYWVGVMLVTFGMVREIKVGDTGSEVNNTYRLLFEK